MQRDVATAQVQTDLQHSVNLLAEQYQKQVILNEKIAEQQRCLLEAHGKAMTQERKIAHLESEMQQRARTCRLARWGLFERETQGNYIPDDIDGM